MSGNRCRRAIGCALLLALLASCSGRQVGQVLYDTGKAYCGQRPTSCGR